ncbi:MAG: uroporphyrinogen-III synthase [Balneolales bacterium]
MKVLSTRETTVEEEILADKMGFELISYPVLRYEFQEPDNYKIESLRDASPQAWAFTSKNGVKGFLKLFEQGLVPVKPQKIYAVGKRTAYELKRIDFKATIPEIENGKALATKIIKEGMVKSVVHFCGNLRRNELSTLLKQNDISVNEIVVYKTITEKPGIKPPEKVRAILFYSPSAVEAFREELTEYNNVPLVAIGPTTSEALKQKRFKPLLEANEASTEAMLKSLKKFLKPQ